MEPHIFIHGLNVCFWNKPKLVSAMLDYFPSAKYAWEAKMNELYESGLFKENHIDYFLKSRKSFDLEKSFLEHSAGEVKCLIPEDPGFPPLLKAIADCPPILYYKGNLVQNTFPIALVGSRKNTVYGKETAYKLSANLAKNGLTVVSGMAQGIDTWSHKGCLEAKGETIAVLGCGLDICYPRGNKELMNSIIKSGMVASEFPLGSQPAKHNFPRRNRIIAGLSKGTVVVEAANRSGALITAQFAMEYNREVFAVPGSIGSPYSRGCHTLIKDGAKLVEDINDILEEFVEFQVDTGYQKKSNDEEMTLSLSGNDKAVLHCIPFTPYHLDQIIEETSQPAEKLLPILLDFEIKGIVKQLPGKFFMRI